MLFFDFIIEVAMKKSQNTIISPHFQPSLPSSIVSPRATTLLNSQETIHIICCKDNQR
jgi:hypothetical protein